VALVATTLYYHEPTATMWPWFFLLVPLALIRVIPEGRFLKIVNLWKWGALGVLVVCLVPFYFQQIQGLLYPQLETKPMGAGSFARSSEVTPASSMNAPALTAPMQERTVLQDTFSSQMKGKAGSRGRAVLKRDISNLRYDAKSKIQTGPGVPTWKWNEVRFGWSSSVSKEQTIQPFIISGWGNRIIIFLRLVALTALFAMMLEWKKSQILKKLRRAGPLGAMLLFLGMTETSQGQIPDSDMLQLLKERLLEVSDAYPNAAEIPHVKLMLGEQKLTMDVEVHAALQVAVPLPGKVSEWSPQRVTLNGSTRATIQRKDGYLWVVVPKGVHKIRQEALLPNTSEWEMSFILKPKTIQVEASGWKVTGIQTNNIPENQLFFVKKKKTEIGQASYDRNDFNPVLRVDRYLELGLVWQVRTVVQRLSPLGKAVSVTIPLIHGENVLTSNRVVKDEMIEVRLGSNQRQISWESEFAITPEIRLQAKETTTYVERWHLVASPVWNIELSGLPPIFNQKQQELVPVWNPWPGEVATLLVLRPEAVSGQTTTIREANYQMQIATRHTQATLNLDLECSLGEDFRVGVPLDAEISNLRHNGTMIPVRRENESVIIPVQPGKQTIDLEWRVDRPLGTVAKMDAVTLPVESSNIASSMRVPGSRWVLWTFGPTQGPAVRFWSVFVFAILFAWLLSRIPGLPLRFYEWFLLALGLTQVHLVAAIFVVSWLLLLRYRGSDAFQSIPTVIHNATQVVIAVLTVIIFGVFLAIVNEGLLGRPEMFIEGNGSSRTNLIWYQPSEEAFLPSSGMISVSIWVYRVLMLAWALWLALVLIQWLKWAWMQFRTNGYWKSGKTNSANVPPIPRSEKN
ncbi:MAG: hypothetical protein AAF558_15630, partial [Verrucomicrobiota bacterium]